MFENTLASGSLIPVTWFGNSIEAWIISLLCSGICFIAMARCREFLKRKINQGNLFPDLELIRLTKVVLNSTTRLFDIAISLSIGAFFLSFSPKYSQVLSRLPFIALLLQIGHWGKTLIQYQIQRFIDTKKDRADRQQVQTVMGPLQFILTAVLWTLISLAVLDNVGVDITALVAGLGIGGIAVALAVQNTLGDLMAALSIAFDKPFVIGDFIIVDEFMGTVERIGLKSTRIRSLGGEGIVIPNKNLLDSRIRNYQKMEERRVILQFGILYQTPYALMKEIPHWVKQIIDDTDGVRFDRAHFATFGSSSYDFEAVYYVLDPDYAIFMNYQQQINLELIRVFESHGVEFAYPTRTLFVNNQAPSPEPLQKQN
ncbi:MAG: mechanosensitive ion channel family protein [Cyanobacteria bacterium P01_H01_bin.74]